MSAPSFQNVILSSSNLVDSANIARLNISQTYTGTPSLTDGSYVTHIVASNFQGVSGIKLTTDINGAHDAGSILAGFFVVRNYYGTVGSPIVGGMGAIASDNVLCIIDANLAVGSLKLKPISSDGSAGLATASITSADLVGKTITVKDGLITGYA